MIQNPYQVIERMRAIALGKYQTPLFKLIVLGILAGVYLSMGALLSVYAAAGTAGWGEANPAIPKLIGGAVFPLGLMMIVIVGAELFTGNTAYLMPATLRGDIPRGYFLKNWLIVYTANLAGALLFDYLLVYKAGMLDTPAYAAYIVRVAEYKTSQPWMQVFLRGIGANWMVCLAVWMGYSSQSMVGRMVGIWWPVMAFVAIGFEHSIANMFYIPTGMLYGADVTWGDFIFANLVPATLGNIIGGAAMVGGLYGYFYTEKK